jgi:hypothetical protein
MKYNQSIRDKKQFVQGYFNHPSQINAIRWLSKSGELYYPAEFSHVFEKYWDFLPNLEGHPGFSEESPYCREQLARFSRTLSGMDLSNFEPRPSVENKDRDVKIALDASISRLLPIQEGDDQWEVHRSSAVTASGASAPE